MYIDFHAHLFPESIAAATLKKLGAASALEPTTDGTANGLLQSMDNAGIDISVVLPVVTKPSQFDSVNRFAASLHAAHPRLISFGGIHPDNEDIEEKLDTIVSLGLPGIKLHPDYQQTFIDDERYRRILQAAIDRDLIVSIHAGIDKGLPDPVHCSPDRTRRLLDTLSIPSSACIILAHGGGWGCWDEVERCLVGQPIYFDLGVTLQYIDQTQLLRLIRRHGAQRILFASDTPWSDQADCVKRFEALPLTENERRLIAFENAERLLSPLTSLE